jgi:5-methyltetrahydropteroyltriglutamate--homocysteine methyltransferase
VKRSSDRILTTHTGSLARPHPLLDLMKARESGQPFDQGAYDTAVRDAVDTVVHKQAECGVDIVNDGEQSKTGFSNYIRDRLTGFERADSRPSGPPRTGGREEQMFPEYYEDYYKIGYFTTRVATVYPLVCRGPISYRPDQLQRDLTNLKEALAQVDAEDAFVPATVPSIGQDNEYYKTAEEYTYAVADAIRTEYQMIVDAGLLLQIDGPGLVRPPANVPAEEGRKAMDMRIEALNYALRDIPEDRVRFHTCFGVNMGPRVTDVGLEQILEPMFRIRAQAYSFEAANPRHMHEYHVFENVKLPEGKIIMPGMVTHAHNMVEHPEWIAEMICNYAHLVGRENVIAGNDCGFSSQAVYRPEVDARVAWAKFEALSEGARLASEALWN